MLWELAYCHEITQNLLNKISCVPPPPMVPTHIWCKWVTGDYVDMDVGMPSAYLIQMHRDEMEEYTNAPTPPAAAGTEAEEQPAASEASHDFSAAIYAEENAAFVTAQPPDEL